MICVMSWFFFSTQAYRLLHPGKLALRFQILEAEKEPVELVEPYIITLKEINGREDYIVEGKACIGQGFRTH